MQARLKGARALHSSRPACSGAHRVQMRRLLSSSARLGVDAPEDRVDQAPAADQAASGMAKALVPWTAINTHSHRTPVPCQRCSAGCRA